MTAPATHRNSGGDCIMPHCCRVTRFGVAVWGVLGFPVVPASGLPPVNDILPPVGAKSFASFGHQELLRMVDAGELPLAPTSANTSHCAVIRKVTSIKSPRSCRIAWKGDRDTQWLPASRHQIVHFPYNNSRTAARVAKRLN